MLMLKMFINLVLFVVMAGSALSRNVPRYGDLDEDDQLLFRAAYDAPYEHEEYQEVEGLPLNKLDLLKDGMWAVKTKIKEMKTINKALAANLLATKLQLKEFLAKHDKSIKKHHHFEIEKKKPVYSYQNSAPQPPIYASYEYPHQAPAYQYEAAHHEPNQLYNAPSSQYAPDNHYIAPAPQFVPPHHYSAPVPQYEPPNYYTTPVTQFEPIQYTTPAPDYEPHQYGQPQYGPPQYGHDPYYGH